MAEGSVVGRLKEKGLKVTKARLAILALLDDDGQHLSADDIKTALDKKGYAIGVATIYRTLSQLEEEGLIQKHYFTDKKAWYEVNTPHHHDHMVCDQCALVIEFYDDTIEAQQINVAKSHGFVVHSHQMTLFGLCQSCSASKD